MYGKSNMETYITIYKIDSQQEFAVWLRKLKEGLYINLDPIIQSEVSQKEKDKYHILTHIWEKAMAPHSSTPAWKIPWMEEPGRLQSMESLRVRHD